MMRACFLFIVLSSASPTSASAADEDRWRELTDRREDYRRALEVVRGEHGGARKLPGVDFFLFGMGGRRKYVYVRGELRDAATGAVVRRWEVAEERIVPPSYAVALRTRDGKLVFLSEDESAVWVEADGRREALSEGAVNLPDFAGRKHRLVLRVLHQEMLVNVVGGRPLPNHFVYSEPWYRDGAMMAMVFEKTGNLHLIRAWILGLREPYDRNNAGEAEADNLGQALYLVSLVADERHPLVPVARKEFARFEKGRGIEGRSDFAAHPVYQTKWAKFGLRALGLDDPYAVPKVADSYAALFWWDFKADDEPAQALNEHDSYPYLGWASSHYAGKRRGKLSDRDYPLTWEAEASQAKYEGMGRIAREFTDKKICTPHTWHAAEAFLYLIEDGE